MFFECKFALRAGIFRGKYQIIVILLVSAAQSGGEPIRLHEIEGLILSVEHKTRIVVIRLAAEGRHAVFINGGSDYIRRAVRAVSGEKVRQ